MFVDFLSSLVTFIIWITSGIFGCALYYSIAHYTKINKIKSDKRFDDYVIVEITKKDDLRIVKLAESSIVALTRSYGGVSDSKEMRTVETRTKYSVHKTLIHNIPNIIINDDIELKHYSCDLWKIEKSHAKYDTIIEKTKGKCTLNTDKCDIFLSEPIENLFFVGKMKDNNLIVEDVSYCIDSILYRLVPPNEHILGFSSLILLLSLLIKFLFYVCGH